MNKRVLYLVATAVAIILFLYGYHIFPIPGTDAVVYIPTAYLYAKGHGLINPLYYITQITDPSNQNLYNYYVPFQAHLLGILSSIKPDYRTIFTWCALFSITGLLLYTRIIASYFSGASGRLARVMMLLSLPYLSIYLLPTVGRPESLTVLMSMLVYILYRNRTHINPWLYNAVLCTLWGLMLATQIMSCFFCFLIFIAYDLLNSSNIGRTVVINTLRLAGIALVFCLALMLSPIGLTETLTGIGRHAAYVISRSDTNLKLFVYYWLLAPLNFGFLIVFLAAAFFHIKYTVGRLRQLSVLHKVLVAAVHLVIAAGFYKFILYAAPTVYNATQFILPITVYVMMSLARYGQGVKEKLPAAVLLLTFAAGGLLFLRTFLLFIDYMQDGKTFQAGRQVAAEIFNKYPRVYFTGLWCLFDDPNEIKVFDLRYYKKGDVVVVQQAYHEFPPELKGKCTIVYDWSTKERRTFMGIPLTRRPQGYSFVLCQMNEDAPAK